MNTAFDLSMNLMKKLPDVDSFKYNDVMPIMRCAGDKIYDTQSFCIVILPSLIGVNAVHIDERSPIILQNIKCINDIICNFSNIMIVSIFKKESGSILFRHSDAIKNVKHELSSLVSHKSELTSLWSQIAIKIGVIQFICSILAGVPLMRVLEDDITSLNDSLSSDEMMTVDLFIPSFVSSDKKMKPTEDQIRRLKSYLGDIPYISKSQSPMAIMCIKKIKELTDSPQPAHDFVQTPLMNSIIDSCTNILIGVAGKIFSNHEMRSYMGYVIYMTYSKIFPNSVRQPNIIKNQMTYNNVVSRLRMAAKYQQ